MIIEDTGWNTNAMTQNSYYDGISPSIAAIITREFGKCPVCGSGISPDVKNSLHEDGDVVWDDRISTKTRTHTCESCEAELSILVEEKAFGIIGNELPDYAETSDTAHFIPLDDSEGYIYINTNQIMISEI